MNKAKKIIATFGLSAMMFQVVVLPAQALTLEVSGNGAESDNTVKVSSEQNTVVSQNNDTSISNNINANANTGGNNADRNTGGNVEVSTGNATSYVGVSNTAGSNQAEVDCCAAQQDVDVLVSGNGYKSDNDVKLNNSNNVQLFQENSTNIKNKINNDAKTGHNSADRNTGGSVEITTGNAVALTSVLNGGNVNSALISGGNAHGGVSAKILQNGAETDNDIRLGLGHNVSLVQNNSARINNDIDTDAVTGKNDADRNTGGDVIIDTGDAHVEVVVDNAVNFNVADVDCGCLLDVTAKIAGNGVESDNKISATLGDDMQVFQDNSCGGYLPRLSLLSNFDFGRYGHKDCLVNNVYADAYTGYNDARENTGSSETDPSISTGDASTLIEVENAGNSNVFGDADFDLPSHNGVNVNISFNLHDLMELLGLLS